VLSQRKYKPAYICRPTPVLRPKVSNLWAARSYYAARCHMCKLCI